ncbi:flagellar basal body P-ring formation protein FlgA [Frischella sp. Ac48]|uniref:Flagella basal body P-ring formation protein FlgA n=1 Tax=Frischella japonica TaxID=2741544 RepID=A0ABR7R0J2_9GAMM|nr:MULTISPECIES: flagellar basal body P-ring formation chaperone FlgA [Frischella]MBC9131979.1 flagellar basal body P-ring formation protein FlgA [Frischella japonica]MBX4132494.1 flagellar basal body P-ring formation protein FlgA [Frischella sp. Ac48]
MIKIKMLFFASYLLLTGNIVFANSLDQQIEVFITEQWRDIADDITIHYSQQRPQLSCDKPTLALLNRHKMSGNVTIKAQCANKQAFIPVNVAVAGNYVVANQAIAAGSLISTDHVRLQSGRLDQLPSTVILQKNQVINHIALRNIVVDQPIKTTMIRKPWQVKAGQLVQLVITGDGYQIITQGKPLTNAALGESVNVRTQSGKIILGTVTNQGITVFNKKN